MTSNNTRSVLDKLKNADNDADKIRFCYALIDAYNKVGWPMPKELEIARAFAISMNKWAIAYTLYNLRGGGSNFDDEEEENRQDEIAQHCLNKWMLAGDWVDITTGCLNISIQAHAAMVYTNIKRMRRKGAISAEDSSTVLTHLHCNPYV
jgi:hypothetical protein